MLTLILKDFRIQRNKLIMSCFSIAFLSVFFPVLINYILPKNMKQFFTLSGMIFVLILFALVYTFIESVFVEEEKNGIIKLIATFPVDRRDIVLCKYISIFVVMILAAFLFKASCLISGSMLPAEAAAVLNNNFSSSLIVGYGLSVGFISLFLPIYFKYGYEKASVISMFSIALCFPIIAAPIGYGMTFDWFKEGFFEVLKSLNSIYALMIFLIITVAIYAISILISISQFKKRSLF